jgi:hypothetical protein
MPVLLLLLFSTALSIGMAIIVLVIRRAQRQQQLSPKINHPPPIAPAEQGFFFRRPSCWLAVKSRSLFAVQSALGLHNAKPCSWVEGLSAEEKLFIAPPVKGWILVLGSGLPDPSDDVDACFRFVVELSRKLGQVQFFCTNRVLQHHAWVRAKRGKIVRAYAWAGRTIWHQGRLTSAEKDLSLRCFDYTAPAEAVPFGQVEAVSGNLAKVPLLAARWSLDPARMEAHFFEADRGIAGEPSWRF